MSMQKTQKNVRMEKKSEPRMERKEASKQGKKSKKKSELLVLTTTRGIRLVCFYSHTRGFLKFLSNLFPGRFALSAALKAVLAKILGDAFSKDMIAAIE